MSAPKVEQIGQGLSFLWEEYHIRVTLDRFRDSGRSMNAEFQATTTAPRGINPI